jgi:hypothetical protein
VMWGDGNVYPPENRIGVVGALSTTTKVADLWKLPKRPRQVTDQGYETFVRDKQFALWFREMYAIGGPKAATLKWPQDMPEELDVHFIRGLWDSDGHLRGEPRKYRDGRTYAYPRAKYSSICESFVVEVRGRVERLFGVPRVKVCAPTPTDACYRIMYGGTSAMPLLHGLYRDAPAEIVNDDRLAIYSSLVIAETMREQRRCKECGRGGRQMLGFCHSCWALNARKPRKKKA